MSRRPATLARRGRAVRASAAAVSLVLAGGVAGLLVVDGGVLGGPGASGVAGPGGAGSAAGSASVGSGAVGSGAGGAGGGGNPTLAPGQSVVTGTVSSVQAGGATGPALPTPLELSVPDRGRGGATFFNVTVNGQPSTIVWNGGEPLGLIGHGALVPGRIGVSIDRSGSTWHLDGAERRVAPGSYEAAAPVAVGQEGLAQPEQSATFQAGPTSVLVTNGGATVHVGPEPLHIIGPGSLVLAGTLQVTTRSATSPAGSVRLPNGNYEIDLTPGPGGLTVHAVLQGAITTG